MITAWKVLAILACIAFVLYLVSIILEKHYSDKSDKDVNKRE